MNKVKVYIAVRINGDTNYKEKFGRMRKKLEEAGFVVLNPAVLPEGMEYKSYMHICLAMIDEADAVLLLPDWTKSRGAVFEKQYGEMFGKKVVEYSKELDLKKAFARTNFEKIKSMSLDEMAESDMTFFFCPYGIACGNCNQGKQFDYDCIACTKHWLESEK